MPDNNFLDIENSRNKEYAEKQRLALEYLNLLIQLINEQAFFHYQDLKRLERETFEKNINLALTLLSAAHEGIRKNGPSRYNDYLITSAMSHIANYLPAKSISDIINKLDAFTSNNVAIRSSKISSERSESSQSIKTKQSTSAKSFNHLMSSVSSNLLTPLHDIPVQFHNDQVIIDFAADELPYREYGIKVAKRLGASLIQAQPDIFSAVNEKFTISKNTTLTIIGHCLKGIDYLADNSGKIIDASELAQQILAKMSQTNTPLDTKFTIDLIACQAGSPKGNHPAFAETFAKELSKRGITNVSVIASPTIMLCAADGRQANLNNREDQEFSERIENGQSPYAETGFFSTFKSFFKSDDEPKLNVEKVTFRAADHVYKP